MHDENDVHDETTEQLVEETAADEAAAELLRTTARAVASVRAQGAQIAGQAPELFEGG